ncbi:MAG TPA: HAMP domain-containing sensor histidine kinase, partial [Anaeromyxobacteraceae bacterium]|nr:HAMP domain-containing sensor histidine kinase [Anaeromyxobacteraceae bacterium]
LIAGPDGAVTFANDESVRVLGHATEAVPALGDWLRRWAFERAHVRSRAVAVDGAGREAPAQGEPVAPFQVPVTGKDGTERTMLVTAAPLGESLLLVLADLSVERSFLDRVALASRAAALAMLGVALSHEVNNPLAAEMADEGVATETCRAARDRLRTEEPVDLQVVARLLEGAIEALVDAQESGHQISRVVRDLARVARPDAERVRELPIDLVHTACRWIPPLVSRTSSVVVEDGGAPAVLAFPGQIEQVILSLIMQAARSSSGGARDTVIVRLGTGPGGCARLEIIDHGPGLDPETRARLLDPRFTPAPATAAEGLGPCLVVCRAIVEAHGGTLSVESALERGTTVRVELPGASMEG